MRTIDIIAKKRDNGELTKEEIEFFIRGYTRGDIPDYQASAWAMAVLLNGMTPQETTDLTMAIVKTGDTIDLSQVVTIAVDKHSTGGVGDKTTLVVEPLVSACGLPVGEMSGRGLGFTGGTLDKMESIPGFDCSLSEAQFMRQLKDVGLVLAGQTTELAPADGKLYALRDVTATVDSIPLIASSIMSKKIAGGAHGVVLDVKVGLGAFMGNLEEAQELASLMVDIAKLAGREAVALLSDMNQPLGHAVGNALEVKEAIETLHCAGPADFKGHCLEVAAHMLILGGIVESIESAVPLMEEVLDKGLAWERFRELIIAQHGDVTCVDNPDRLPKASLIENVPAPCTGYLDGINAREIGEAAVVLGAGRAKKGDPVDHAVGFEIHHKVGDRVAIGDALFTIHANDQVKFTEARARLLDAHTWRDEPTEPLPLFYGIVK